VTEKLKDNLNFIIGLLNIRSLRKKFDQIKFILDEGPVDILVIQETWFDDRQDDKLFTHLKYYMIRRNISGRKGGGLLVFISRAYKVLVIETNIAKLKVLRAVVAENQAGQKVTFSKHQVS
jgi:exonuclease III